MNEAGIPGRRDLLSRNAVVRNDNLPLPVQIHPDVSEAVPVFVGLSPVGTFLVIGTGDDRGIAMRANAQAGPLCGFNVEGRISIVRDVSRLAEGAAIFERDDEIISQQ